MMKKIKLLALIATVAAAGLQLNGCATVTSSGECAVESLNPTVMAALDSFESAALSIQLSNRVLRSTPLSEQDEWPAKMYGAPSGAALLKMGLSMFGSSQGVTIPTEIDPETGFPRPTSALYIFLSERNRMLDKEISRDDLNFFASSTEHWRELGLRRKPDTVNEFMYRNPLMAYGVVTGNKNEVLELQQDIEANEQGFRTCNAFIHKTSEEVKDEKVKKANCPDMALKDEKAKAKLTADVEARKKELAELEKQYGKLANKVYKASVSGADFTAAAMVKIGCAIVNGARALPNINKEFKGLKGVYNIAMVLPRIKNAFSAFGIYKDNLGVQYTVYSTMYSQIKGIGYDIKDDEPTKQALMRIEAVRTAMAELEPKLQLAAAGKEVTFTDAEAMRMNTLATLFPADLMQDRLMRVALGQ